MSDKSCRYYFNQFFKDAWCYKLIRDEAAFELFQGGWVVHNEKVKVLEEKLNEAMNQSRAMTQIVSQLTEEIKQWKKDTPKP